MKIPSKFKVQPQGRINKGVYECYACDFKAPNYNVTPFIVGFADHPAGLMVVWQCPECGSKSMFHQRKDKHSMNYVVQFESFLSGDVDWIERSHDRKYLED